MQRIDVEWLRKAGVPGTNQELQSLADDAYSVLELRIGDKISQELNDAQLEEAERLAAEGTMSIEWLEEACPEYWKIVRTEYARLRRGILRSGNKTQYILSQKG